MTVEQIISPQSTRPGFLRRTFQQLWAALMLQADAYQSALEAPSPVRHGLKVLAVLYLAAGLFAALGLVFQYLTLPRIELIQQQVYGLVTANMLFQSWIAQQPLWGIIFKVGYRLFWFYVSLRSGYPSRWDILLAPLSLLIMGVFNWTIFAMFGDWAGRKLSPETGEQPRRHAFYAALAIANAPQLLLILNLVPGLHVPTGLVASWTVLTSYQALRAAFPGLTWKRGLVAVIIMYALNYLLIVLAFILGVVLGVVFYQVFF